LDKAREQLYGTIDMSLVKINSVADLEIDPSLISYIDAEGNAKLRNVVPAKVILGINEDKS